MNGPLSMTRASYRQLMACASFALLPITANAMPCHDRDHIAAYLQHNHGMTLWGWGIDIEGDMLELFTAEGGRFAVIKTRPDKCATMIWAEEHGGRLVDPPRRNPAIPPALHMDRGTPL